MRGRSKRLYLMMVQHASVLMLKNSYSKSGNQIQRDSYWYLMKIMILARFYCSYERREEKYQQIVLGRFVVFTGIILYLSQQMLDDQLQGLNGEQLEVINTVSFNWDNSCMALATSKGFKILSTQPLKLKQSRDLGAPLQMVEMIDRSNLLAFVGFENSSFVSYRIAIFDDNTNSIIADMTFESNILGVKVRMKKMIVALAARIYLVDFFTLEVLHILPTIKFPQEEPYNLISLSADPDNFLLACPTLEAGHLLLVNMQTEKQRRIRAHQSMLGAIAITLNGDKVATASEKGMNIRIFNSLTGDLLQEVRRGNEFGMIYSLNFSRGGNWLCCTSDSDVVHVFASIPNPESREKRYESKIDTAFSNPKSLLYIFRKFLPYFDAEYSYCRFEMPDFESEMVTVAGFGFHDDALLLVNDYGSFKRIELNLKGGKCKQVMEVCELMQVKK